MRFSPIAVAVAAALLSFGAVAQEKKEESKAGSTMSQEQKPSTAPAAGGASAEKKEGAAAAGASAEKKEGAAAAGASADVKAKGAAAGETKAGQSPEVIKQVQTKLKEQGHDVGAADGVMGPKTQKGLKDFQTSKGMKATGQLDQQTLSALGVSEAAAGGASAKAEKKTEGAAPAGAGATAPAAGASTPEKKPEQPAAPAGTEKPGEKKSQ